MNETLNKSKYNPLGMGNHQTSIRAGIVNRIPINGTITAAVYRPGKFLNASLDKASEQNERQSLKAKTEEGKENIV